MTWTFDAPEGVFKNRQLSDALYEMALDDRCFLHRRSGCQECFPPLTRWQLWRLRVSNLWDAWRPRLHFGPCDHSGCE